MDAPVPRNTATQKMLTQEGFSGGGPRKSVDIGSHSHLILMLGLKAIGQWPVFKLQGPDESSLATCT